MESQPQDQNPSQVESFIDFIKLQEEENAVIKIIEELILDTLAIMQSSVAEIDKISQNSLSNLRGNLAFLLEEDISYPYIHKLEERIYKAMDKIIASLISIHAITDKYNGSPYMQITKNAIFALEAIEEYSLNSAEIIGELILSKGQIESLYDQRIDREILSGKLRSGKILTTVELKALKDHQRQQIYTGLSMMNISDNLIFLFIYISYDFAIHSKLIALKESIQNLYYYLPIDLNELRMIRAKKNSN